MRKLLLLISFFPGFLYAQQMPDDGLNKVRIVATDKTQQAEVKPVSGEPTIKQDRLYYWYAANIIHATQGGYSGRLLNGLYNEYYPDKNLKEQGDFKNGLKDGTWKKWNDDGTLNEVCKWKNGILQPDVKISFWKKLSFFKKMNIFKKRKAASNGSPTPKSS